MVSVSSSFEEVAGEAAGYFVPTNEDLVRESVKKVVYNERLRENLKQKGFEKLNKCSGKELPRKPSSSMKNFVGV